MKLHDGIKASATTCISLTKTSQQGWEAELSHGLLGKIAQSTTGLGPYLLNVDIMNSFNHGPRTWISQATRKQASRSGCRYLFGT